eukprot:m.72001 g.72001  ORF g.72001 m.72001 type:complete len:200 (+) comp24415_c0_seq2:430-1029(+)
MLRSTAMQFCRSWIGRRLYMKNTLQTLPGCKRFASQSSRVRKRLQKDHYKTLEITPKATAKDIKAAYYKQSMIHHPDKNPGSASAAAKFQAATEAYNILGTVHLRERYDMNFGAKFDPKFDPTRPTNRKAMFDKSKVKYNFDEFYNRHYGDALRHAQMRKKREQLFREQAKAGGEDESGIWMLATVPVAIFLLYKIFGK